MIVFGNHDRVSKWRLELVNGQMYHTRDSTLPDLWPLPRRVQVRIPQAVPQSNQKESPGTEVPSSPISLSNLAVVLSVDPSGTGGLRLACVLSQFSTPDPNKSSEAYEVRPKSFSCHAELEMGV